MSQASARRAEQPLLGHSGTGGAGVRVAPRSDVPDRVKQIARLALLDWYAVTWAGATEPPVQIVRAEIEAQGGHPQARLIGSSLRTSTLGAAVVNGTAGHVLDYDDVQNILPGHATAPVAPALLALAESIGASGEALLLAFIAGFETTCRIGALTSPAAVPARLSGHDAGRRHRRCGGLREAAQSRCRRHVGRDRSCRNAGQRPAGGVRQHGQVLQCRQGGAERPVCGATRGTRLRVHAECPGSGARLCRRVRGRGR